MWGNWGGGEGGTILEERTILLVLFLFNGN